MITHQDQKNNNSNITIIVLFYNQERYVSDLLDNIKACNIKVNAKVIMVDDCSSDNTSSYIESWLALNNEMTWKFIKNPSNIGISASILRAIEVVDTKWIKCHAGDDMFAPEGIKEFVTLSKIHDPDQAIIMTAVNIINEANEIIGSRDNPSPLTFTKYFNDVNYYINPLLSFSVLAGKEVYTKAIKAMYFRNVEDWPLLIYAVKNKIKFILVEKRLVSYRVHDKSIMAHARDNRLKPTAHQQQYNNEIMGILRRNASMAPSIWARYGAFLQLLNYKYSASRLSLVFFFLKLTNLKYVTYRLCIFFRGNK